MCVTSTKSIDARRSREARRCASAVVPQTFLFTVLPVRHILDGDIDFADRIHAIKSSPREKLTYLISSNSTTAPSLKAKSHPENCMHLGFPTHLTLRIPSVLLVAHTVGLLNLAATPVPVAGVTLTLDNPNPTIALPLSGSIEHVFTGTLSFAPGFTWSETTLLYPFIDGALPGLVTGGNLGFPYPGAENGGSYVGDLFKFTINASDTPGVYDEGFGGGPATYRITATDGVTSPFDFEPYTITLVAHPVIPEATPFGASSVVFGMFGAIWFHKRQGRTRVTT
jgi:hypothetical protein